MHSLSSLAIVMLATLTLTAAAAAFALWLFWLLPASAWHGDVGHLIERPCLHPALWRLLVSPSRRRS
jgi:hypothetical protein